MNKFKIKNNRKTFNSTVSDGASLIPVGFCCDELASFSSSTPGALSAPSKKKTFLDKIKFWIALSSGFFTTIDQFRLRIVKPILKSWAQPFSYLRILNLNIRPACTKAGNESPSPLSVLCSTSGLPSELYFANANPHGADTLRCTIPETQCHNTGKPLSVDGWHRWLSRSVYN